MMITFLVPGQLLLVAVLLLFPAFHASEDLEHLATVIYSGDEETKLDIINGRVIVPAPEYSKNFVIEIRQDDLEPRVVKKPLVANGHLCITKFAVKGSNITWNKELEIIPHYSEAKAFETLKALAELRLLDERPEVSKDIPIPPELDTDIRLYYTNEEYVSEGILGRLLDFAYEDNPRETIRVFYQMINSTSIFFIYYPQGPMAADFLEKYRHIYEHNQGLFKEHYSKSYNPHTSNIKINAFLECSPEQEAKREAAYQAIIDSFRSQHYHKIARDDSKCLVENYKL